jgi:hypothetical protein
VIATDKDDVTINNAGDVPLDVEKREAGVAG